MSCVRWGWCCGAQTCSYLGALRNSDFCSAPEGIIQAFSAEIGPNELTAHCLCVCVCARMCECVFYVWVAELIKMWAGFCRVLFSWQFHLNDYPKCRRMGILWAFGRIHQVARFYVVFCVVVSQGQGEASARGTTMEGDCLSCIKYLMFVFNFLIFVSIAHLSISPHLAISEVSVNSNDLRWAPGCPLPDWLMEPHLHFIRWRQSWFYQILLWLDFSVLTHIWGTVCHEDFVTGTWVYQSWSDNQG